MSSEAELKANLEALYTERNRLRVTGGRPNPLDATVRRLRGDGAAVALVSVEAWDAAHPEARAVDAQIEATEIALKALGEAKARETEFAAALACLDDVPRIQAAVRAGLRPTEATAAVAEFAAANAWCLLLLGSVGCGKSTAVGDYVVKEQVAAGPRRPVRERPLWVRCVEASRMSGFGEQAEARFERMRTAKVLVLDDLGAELATPVWQQVLDDVMDCRYQHSSRTVITCNLPVDEFKARFGERLVDRIREDGLVRQLAGDSLRKPLDRRTRRREGDA